MNRCFRILGLTEHATKAQVEEAYKRRVARYKGPDYMEEPEYANRKLMELRGAYEEALRLAENGMSSSSTRRISSTKDLKRKNAMSTVKDTVKNASAQKNKGINKQQKHKRAGFFSDLNELNADKIKSVWQTLKSNLQGVAGTFPAANKKSSTVRKRQKERANGSEIFSLIVMLLIVGFILFGSCGDEDISSDYDYDYVDEYGVEYEYDYIDNYGGLIDEDIQIQEVADSSGSQLYMQDMQGSAKWSIDDEAVLRPVADEFAKKYWNKDSLEDVTEYLQTEFAEYPGDSSMTLDQQLNYIFPFYGFLPVDEAQWYENSYTGERIECYADYLHYLMQYYDEYHQNEVQCAHLTEYDHPAASDLKISEMATESADLLYEQESEPFSYTMYSMEDESALASQAPTFAKYYWGKDSIEEVTLYLNETYKGYPVEPTASLESQLDAIFVFYGFAPVEDAVWYNNPYTQGRIKSVTYYLIYLIDHYEETQ